jgi:MFS transporter, Spinster family, sphingosine-1-phosphate transporter
LTGAVLLAGTFGVVPPCAVQLALVIVGTAAVSSAVGPVMAVVIDVVPPGLRATATSLAVLVMNLGGLAVGPVLTGLLSDRFGLVPALAAVSALGVAASAALWQGSRHYPRDRAAAALRGAVTSPGSAASAPRTRPRSARPAP